MQSSSALIILELCAMWSTRSLLAQNSKIMELSGCGRQWHRLRQHHQGILGVDSNPLPPPNRALEWDPGNHCLFCIWNITRYLLLLLLIKMYVVYILVCNMMLQIYMTPLSGNSVFPAQGSLHPFSEFFFTMSLYQMERKRKDLDLQIF